METNISPEGQQIQPRPQSGQPAPGKKRLVVAFVVLAILIVGAAIFVYFKTDLFRFGNKHQSQSTSAANIHAQPQAQPLKPLSVLQALPGHDEIRGVSRDPIEPNLVWIATQGLISAANLQTGKYDHVLKVDREPNALARRGDYIYFSSYQAGLERVNINTGELKFYGMAQGLPNSTNVVMADDPYSNDLWISTFKGLSRFDPDTEQFENLTSLPESGTELQPVSTIVFTKNFVWTGLLASSFSKGGIIRYDRATKTWRYWGPEAFGFKDRIDLAGTIIGDDQHALFGAYGNGVKRSSFSYDFNNDVWRPVSPELAEDLFSHVHGFIQFKNNILYYVDYVNNEPELFTYNFDTRKRTDTGLPGQPVSDPLQNRPLMTLTSNYFLHVQSGSGFASYPLPKLNLPDAIRFFAGKDNFLYFDGADAIQVLNVDTGEIRPAVPADFPTPTVHQLARSAIIQGKVVTVDFPDCGMDCSDGTISLSELGSFNKDESSINLSSDDALVSQVYSGSTLDDLYVSAADPQTNKNIYEKVDFTKGTLTRVNLTPDQLKNLSLVVDEQDNGYGSFNGDSIYVEPSLSYHRQPLVEYRIAPDQTFHPLDLPQLPLDPENSNDYTQQTVVRFQSDDPNTVWIGTVDGLIAYNFATKTAKGYTTADGLEANRITDVYATKDYVAVQHQVGIYIYKINK